jgi:hypothetical protein
VEDGLIMLLDKDKTSKEEDRTSKEVEKTFVEVRKVAEKNERKSKGEGMEGGSRIPPPYAASRKQKFSSGERRALIVVNINRLRSPAIVKKLPGDLF